MSDEVNIVDLARRNLAKVLTRSLERDGHLSEQELAEGSFFCRALEAEKPGASPYAILPRVAGIDGDVAHAARALSSAEPS